MTWKKWCHFEKYHDVAKMMSLWKISWRGKHDVILKILLAPTKWPGISNLYKKYTTSFWFFAREVRDPTKIYGIIIKPHVSHDPKIFPTYSKTKNTPTHL
jgi:hypothetical protein